MARLSSLRASAAYSSEEGEDQGSVSNMLVHYFHPGSFPESCGCGGLEIGFWGMLACGAEESLETVGRTLAPEQGQFHSSLGERGMDRTHRS